MGDGPNLGGSLVEVGLGDAQGSGFERLDVGEVLLLLLLDVLLLREARLGAEHVVRLDERLDDLLARAALVAQLGNVGGRQGLALVGVGEVAIVLLDLHIWKSFREGEKR